MNRRDIVKSALLAAVSASAATPQIDLEELTVDDVQKGFHPANSPRNPWLKPTWPASMRLTAMVRRSMR